MRTVGRWSRCPKTDLVRTKQKALLTGLLFCKSCERPMIATYAAKRGLRYRYYLCKEAQRNGWKSCPTKSVPATLIEDSIVAQLRSRLSEHDARVGLQVPDLTWQAFLQGDCTGLVEALIEKIRYDGSTGTVSVALRSLEGIGAKP